MLIADLYRAYQAGESLKNPAGWKKGQELTNRIGAVLAGVIVAVRYFYPDVVVPDGVTEYAVEAIGAILVIINLYLTRATTTKNVAAAEVPTKVEVQQ